MLLNRAIQLADQHDKVLKAGLDSMFDLYNKQGDYIDSLYAAQIAELQEDDYIEFYLSDF